MTVKKGIIPLLSLTGFLIAAFFVSHYENLSFDAVICEAVYAARNQTLTAGLKAVTYCANRQTISLICICLLFIKKTRSVYGFQLSVAAILSSVSYVALKQVFMRSRPDVALHLVQESGFSFPSGHSMTGLVFYGLLCILLNRNLTNKTTAKLITVVLCLMIFLIGCSRVYLGVHYPTDVLGGFFIGTTVLFLFLFGHDRLASVKKDAL